MNAGIDYGLGRTNIDHATGIRYGVINANEVGQAWFDGAESDYGQPHCPKCGNEAGQLGRRTFPRYERDKHDSEEYVCKPCKYVFGPESAYGDSPVAFNYDQDGYVITQGGDDSDLFVIKSPFYTYAQFCSPCAPGAGHLGNPREKGQGVRTYALGHDWFEDGKAPYKVYGVETDQEVLPETE